MADADALTPEKWRAAWVGVAIVVLAVALVYFPAAGFPFYNWDDQETLTGNPWFHPVSIEHLRQAWSRPYMSLYIPVTYTLWSGIALIARGGGTLSPVVFHVANVSLHAASSAVVYLILRRLTQTHWPSVLGALVFAAHPVQVEPVAWTSGGKDLLCGLFSLLAIHAHLLANQTPERRPWTWRVASLLCFALALLSKPSAVMLPFMLAVVDLLLLRRTFRSASLVCGMYLVLSIPIAVVGRLVQTPADGVFAPPLWQRFSVAGDAIFFYARQIVAPVHLMVDYGRAPQWLVAQPWATVSWIGIPLLVAAVLLARRAAPGIATGVAIAGLAVTPVLGFLPFEFQHYSTVADHYLYLAMLGPALIIAWLFRHGSQKPLALAAALVVLLAVRSFAQLHVWSDTHRLFEHNLDQNPTSLAAAQTLGFLAARENDPAAAAALYSLVLTNYPDDALTHFNFGNLFLSAGQPNQAVEHLRRAVALKPNGPGYRTNLGIALVSAGHLPEGIDQLRQSVAANPTSAEAHFNLGKALKMAGDPGAALEFQKAMDLDPRFDRARRELASDPSVPHLHRENK